jgi:hypothetical protein
MSSAVIKAHHLGASWCILVSLTLAGCVAMQPPSQVRQVPVKPVDAATFCSTMAAIAPGITFSSQDTPETRAQIARVNAAWKKCPQFKPRPRPKLKTDPAPMPTPVPTPAPAPAPVPLPGPVPTPPLTWPIPTPK